jgi:group II intron reverse transcriptase/maturase/CRISPR-associated endonuclease Cas1
MQTTIIDTAVNLVDALAQPQRLRDAWFRVRAAAGGPGIDGVSVDAFRRQAEARLDAIRRSIETRSYAPGALRRVRIPKASGGWRLLAIPTVTDRIVQTACALVLQDHLAPSFSARSFAYRPFLGPRRAALHLSARLSSASHIVTADIEKFFDNVEHQIVAQQLSASGIDAKGIAFLMRWLRAPIVDGNVKLHPLKGIPQGAPVSPVLANMFLSGFDFMLEASGREHVRYADDFVVLARSQADAEEALRSIDDYLRTHLQLALKAQKTQYVALREGFTFVGFRFTDSSWLVPDASVDDFKTRIDELLKDRRRESVFDIAKQHNDLVRGWRNYYGGNSPEMDKQLEALETWRTGSCNGYLQAVGADSVLGRSAFESLTSTFAAGGPRGTYADDRTPDTSVDEGGWPSDDPWHAGDVAAVARQPSAHSTRKQLRTQDVASRQRPSILHGRLLRIPTYGAFVTHTGSILVVRRKKQTIFECPFADVSHVSIESDGVCVSTRVLAQCARRRISVTMSTSSGIPLARVLPIRSELKPGLAERQVVARLTTDGTAIARAILSAKIANQRALLLYHAKYPKRDDDLRASLKTAAADLRALQARIRSVSGLLSTMRTPLFLAEARAAARYWSAFARAIPSAAGFTARRGRGATDLVNKLLNFGYWSLHLRVRSAIEHAGLDPAIGLLHTSRRKTPGLVFDAMEEFRQPLVDRVVLSLVGRGSRLELNDRGELTSHTRTIAQRAFSRALERREDGTRTMLDVIHRQAKALARALTDGSPYEPYRSIW